MEADKLMIVAHPDDESIFGGVELIREKGWAVISVTGSQDIIRSNEMIRAMRSIDVPYQIWGYEDKWEGDFDRVELIKDLKEILSLKEWKKVATHSPTGEYGHTQHIALFEVVDSLVEDNLYVFTNEGGFIGWRNSFAKTKLLRNYKTRMRGFAEILEYILTSRLKKIR